jgi:hypothetical protein
MDAGPAGGEFRSDARVARGVKSGALGAGVKSGALGAGKSGALGAGVKSGALGALGAPWCAQVRVTQRRRTRRTQRT